MTMLGSVTGCMLLYFIGRKGGQVAFHSRAGKNARKIHHWVEHNGFVSMMIAAILPPPTPFKLFVLAAGALGMPVRQFLLAMVLSRGLRFYGEGYLAVQYGPQAIHYLTEHKAAFLAAMVLFILGFYLLVRFVFRAVPEHGS
jgi:membrane protein YqaA with SNARE-associated domain